MLLSFAVSPALLEALTWQFIELFLTTEMQSGVSSDNTFMRGWKEESEKSIFHFGVLMG